MVRYDKFKRLFDAIVSIAALLVLSPLLLAVAVAVRILLGSPVIFRQVRPGLRARPFTLLKFRTMTDARGDDGGLLPDGERLTSFGRMLRATSLDELPELLNVLRGEMSLVGPRPLSVKYLPLYTEEQARRHEVRPGLTGLAQIAGRNDLSWEERFIRDVEYVDRRSLWLDLHILFLTVPVVFGRKGVRVSGTDEVRSYEGRR